MAVSPLPTAADMTLMATRWPVSEFLARYTVPMAPLPSSLSTANGPIFCPTSMRDSSPGQWSVVLWLVLVHTGPGFALPLPFVQGHYASHAAERKSEQHS